MPGLEQGLEPRLELELVPGLEPRLEPELVPGLEQGLEPQHGLFSKFRIIVNS